MTGYVDHEKATGTGGTDQNASVGHGPRASREMMLSVSKVVAVSQEIGSIKNRGSGQRSIRLWLDASPRAPSADPCSVHLFPTFLPLLQMLPHVGKDAG